MRVAFDYSIFNAQQFGGISRYFARIMNDLPDFGITPKVISPLYTSNALLDLPKAMVWGKHVAPSERQRLRGMQLGEWFHRPLASLFGARIVHETYFHAYRIAPAKCSVVLTVYDMIFELNPDLADAEWVIRNKRGAIERADKIICISESTRRDLLRFFPEVSDRTEVILLGFDHEFMTREVASSLHAKPYILYVGMRRDYKNFGGLLDAYGESQKLRSEFDLVCVGGGAFSADEKGRIEELGLSETVVQRDADDAALKLWYRHASVFAYPSLYEGFGIPPLEAMAAECPVVCMNISSMPEVCAEAAEYADPAVPETLASALENVLFSSARSNALRIAGRERLKRFSWRECAREHSEVYKALA